MKKNLLLLTFFIFTSTFAKNIKKPDTVLVGTYITSIYDIDFKEKQYTISLWLWFKYKNHDFSFDKYMEIPAAKSYDKSFYSVDTLKDGRIYMLMKLQCVMKDSWKIKDFPFDRQKLKFSIENSEFDSKDLVFVQDTLGKHYSQWNSPEWKIVPDSFKIAIGTKKYETAFGDPESAKPHSEFSSYKVQIGIARDSWGMFLKIFLGMYISFLISFACFFIHSDNMDSRFGLSVGSLFAVIGNKYVIDSSLPESTSFTLVDTLHGLTLLFVFAVVASSVHSLKLNKQDKIKEANRYDRNAAFILLLTYLALNVLFVSIACNN